MNWKNHVVILNISYFLIGHILHLSLQGLERVCCCLRDFACAVPLLVALTCHCWVKMTPPQHPSLWKQSTNPQSPLPHILVSFLCCSCSQPFLSSIENVCVYFLNYTIKPKPALWTTELEPRRSHPSLWFNDGTISNLTLRVIDGPKPTDQLGRGLLWGSSWPSMQTELTTLSQEPISDAKPELWL